MTAPRTSVPRISIVTPSLNQGEFIGSTARSVIGQQYANLEYIIMDGGSTDGTRDVLEPMADRITHLISEPDNGQSDAVAKGMALATGEICAWLNSDDVLLPGALDVVADTFATHPDLDWIYSHRVFIDEHNRVTGYWNLPEHSNHRMRLRDMIPQETCFWRRSLMERAGGVDTSLQFAFDYELFLRFMDAGRCRRMDAPLAAFREHPASKTATQYTTIGQRELRTIARLHALPTGARARAGSRIFREQVRWRSRTAPPGFPERGTILTFE